MRGRCRHMTEGLFTNREAKGFGWDCYRGMIFLKWCAQTQITMFFSIYRDKNKQKAIVMMLDKNIIRISFIGYRYVHTYKESVSGKRLVLCTSIKYTCVKIIKYQTKD